MNHLVENLLNQAVQIVNHQKEINQGRRNFNVLHQIGEMKPERSLMGQVMFISSFTYNSEPFHLN